MSIKKFYDLGLVSPGLMLLAKTKQKLSILTLFIYNSKILYNDSSICTNVLFGLNLSSLQQKLSLTSTDLGTNTVVVKRVDCIVIDGVSGLIQGI